jgi:hypothetical protein
MDAGDRTTAHQHRPRRPARHDPLVVDDDDGAEHEKGERRFGRSEYAARGGDGEGDHCCGREW